MFLLIVNNHYWFYTGFTHVYAFLVYSWCFCYTIGCLSLGSHALRGFKILEIYVKNKTTCWESGSCPLFDAASAHMVAALWMVHLRLQAPPQSWMSGTHLLVWMMSIMSAPMGSLSVQAFYLCKKLCYGVASNQTNPQHMKNICATYTQQVHTSSSYVNNDYTINKCATCMQCHVYLLHMRSIYVCTTFTNFLYVLLLISICPCIDLHIVSNSHSWTSTSSSVHGFLQSYLNILLIHNTSLGPLMVQFLPVHAGWMGTKNGGCRSYRSLRLKGRP